MSEPAGDAPGAVPAGRAGPDRRFARTATRVGLALAIACVVASAWVRLAQLDTWLAHPDVYFPDGVPAMRTL